MSPVSAANDSYLANNPGLGTTDLDGGGANDFFLSFQVEMPSLNQAFQSIVSTSTGTTPDPLSASSPMQLILGTSTQSNSLNQDFAGSDPSDPNYDGSKTWAELGMASAPYTAEGTGPIPEPAAYGLLIALSASIVTACRRRRVR